MLAVDEAEVITNTSTFRKLQLNVDECSHFFIHGEVEISNTTPWLNLF